MSRFRLNCACLGENQSALISSLFCFCFVFLLLVTFIVFVHQSKSNSSKSLACADRSEDRDMKLEITEKCNTHAHVSFLTISLNFVMLQECSQSYLFIQPFSLSAECVLNSRVTSYLAMFVKLRSAVSISDCRDCSFPIHSHLSSSQYLRLVNLY